MNAKHPIIALIFPAYNEKLTSAQTIEAFHKAVPELIFM